MWRVGFRGQPRNLVDLAQIMRPKSKKLPGHRSEPTAQGGT
jgi:hypothetical protein